MPDYCLIFSVVIIIYSSKELRVCCQSRELQIPLDVKENQAEVEQLFLDDTKQTFPSSCEYVTEEKRVEP